MKILSTSSYDYNRRGLVSKSYNNTRANHLHDSLSSITEHSFDTVSFKKKQQGIFINDMREIPDLPCACCGTKMLRNSAVNKFLNDKIYYPASISLRRIKSEHLFNESKASSEMQEAYSYLKDYADLNPKMTMDEILTKSTVKQKRSKLTPEASECFDRLRELSNLISHDSKYMVYQINLLNPHFHKFEKKAFKELEKLAKKYPNENFHDILNKPEIKNYYLENLKSKQLHILKKVEITAKYEEPKLKEEIKQRLKTAQTIFTEEKEDVYHKRMRVIELFEELFSKGSDMTPVGNQIMEILNRLPDSKNDLDAFMIKGSQQNSNKMIKILIGRVRNTFEHVKPHRRENDNGASDISNYIGLCGKCNTERQRTRYDIFTKIHPEMIENEQKQLNKIISFINKGILIKHDEYPEKIKQALDTESNGVILVDTSLLNLQEAKINRANREKLYVEMKKTQSKKGLIYKFGKGYFAKTGPDNIKKTK